MNKDLSLGLSKLMECSLKIKVEILTNLDSERYLHRIDGACFFNEMTMSTTAVGRAVA